MYVVYALPRLSAYFPVYSSAVIPQLSVSAILIGLWLAATVARRVQPDPTAGIGAVVFFCVVRGDALGALCAALLFASVRLPRHRAWLEVALALCAGILGLLATVFLLSTEPTHITSMARFYGPPRDPNDMAQVALLGLFACLVALDRGEKWPAPLAVLGLVAVLASHSRAAICVMAVVGLVFAIRWARRSRWLAGLSLGALALGLALTPFGFWYRLGRLFTGADLGRRDDLARSAWDMFAHNPLRGVGNGAFQSHQGQGMAPHSILLEVPAEGGLLLALVFGAMVWLLAADVRRSLSPLRWLTPLALLLAAVGPMDARVLALMLAVAPLTATLAAGKHTP